MTVESLDMAEILWDSDGAVTTQNGAARTQSGTQRQPAGATATCQSIEVCT